MTKLKSSKVSFSLVFPKISLVWTDDWQALYVNGRKRREGHSLSAHDVLNSLGLVHTTEEIQADENGDSFFEAKFEDLNLVNKKNRIIN